MCHQTNFHWRTAISTEPRNFSFKAKQKRKINQKQQYKYLIQIQFTQTHKYLYLLVFTNIYIQIVRISVVEYILFTTTQIYIQCYSKPSYRSDKSDRM